MAILKKQPTKKCDSSGNVINIIAHDKEKVHEGENVKSENEEKQRLEQANIRILDEKLALEKRIEIEKQDIQAYQVKTLCSFQ